MVPGREEWAHRDVKAAKEPLGRVFEGMVQAEHVRPPPSQATGITLTLNEVGPTGRRGGVGLDVTSVNHKAELELTSWESPRTTLLRSPVPSLASVSPFIVPFLFSHAGSGWDP